MDRNLREWMRSLSVPTTEPTDPEGDVVPLSGPGADYLVRITTDGTLKAALADVSVSDPELAG